MNSQILHVSLWSQLFVKGNKENIFGISASGKNKNGFVNDDGEFFFKFKFI